MMTLRTCAAFGLALAIHASAALGANAQQAVDNNRVIVPGARIEEAIQNFVGEIAVANKRSENQLSRWDRVVCPSIVGLRASYAQLAIDQISRRALEIGLTPGEPNCTPNILIIVSNQPGAVAQGIYDHYARKLGYYYTAKTMGRDALKAFVTSTAPVRWWHVNYTVNGDGEHAVGSGRSSVSMADPQGIGERPAVAVRQASHIKRASRQDAAMAFLIVDGKRLDGMDLTAVSDYLAMASLAQLDPEADTSSHPTILNLFDQRQTSARPISMTEWDLAYLKGLYGATRQAMSANSQENEIASSMKKDLTN